MLSIKCHRASRKYVANRRVVPCPERFMDLKLPAEFCINGKAFINTREFLENYVEPFM